MTNTAAPNPPPLLEGWRLALLALILPTAWVYVWTLTPVGA